MAGAGDGPIGNVSPIGTRNCFAAYCASRQYKRGITVQGYRFRQNGEARNFKIRWRCTRDPRCKARLHTMRDRIVYLRNVHICGPPRPEP